MVEGSRGGRGGRGRGAQVAETAGVVEEKAVVAEEAAVSDVEVEREQGPPAHIFAAGDEIVNVRNLSGVIITCNHGNT